MHSLSLTMIGGGWLSQQWEGTVLVEEIWSSLFVPWDIMGLRSPGYLQICAKMGLWFRWPVRQVIGQKTLQLWRNLRPGGRWKVGRHHPLHDLKMMDVPECFRMFTGWMLWMFWPRFNVVRPDFASCAAFAVSLPSFQRPATNSTKDLDDGRTGVTWDCKTAVKIRNAWMVLPCNPWNESNIEANVENNEEMFFLLRGSWWSGMVHWDTLSLLIFSADIIQTPRWRKRRKKMNLLWCLQTMKFGATFQICFMLICIATSTWMRGSGRQKQAAGF